MESLVSLDVKTLGPGAAEIGPLDISPPTLGDLRAAFAAYPVLVIRDQRLTVPELARFCKLFGELETYRAAPVGVAPPTAALRQTGARATPDPRLYPCPEDDAVLLMTNEMRADIAPLAVIDNAETWHSDGAHKPRPYKAVGLHVVRNPAEGGETEFCDMSALYEALPGFMRNMLAGLFCAHHWSKSRNSRFAASLTPEAFAEGERVAKLFPETLHPLVCLSEEDRRPHLYLSPRFTLRVDGLAPEVSTTLLENLFALMEQPAFTYTHIWRDGDLVLWDNRRVNHRVRAYAAEDLRSRYRVTVSATGPMRAHAPPAPVASRAAA